ncbi:MAG TPA: cupin domain-containing protein [Candidatus Nitrosotalea sp.]|nr:cupin domain-containing protein [Candidatus Nitrosotalea sp.]
MKTVFDTNEYLEKIAKGRSYFYTFLNRENIAAGILRLGPGEEDTQTPHHNDEVYYVVKGTGFLNVEGKDIVVYPGISCFITKNQKHYFHGNKDELVVVYFFSGPDS